MEEYEAKFYLKEDHKLACAQTRSEGKVTMSDLLEWKEGIKKTTLLRVPLFC